LLQDHRIVDAESRLICPLCLELISGDSFFDRVSQAQGRETWDLTNTEVSLFHINELRVGTLQHRPYNLGWGHHFCNVVAKDAGIDPTLDWMHEVLERNISSGWGSQREDKVPPEVSEDHSPSDSLLRAVNPEAPSEE